jgi:hypothetical protein
MARATGAQPKAAAGGGGSVPWLLGMVCGAILAFATPSAILGGVLLAPGILAAVFDTHRKRPMARVVVLSCTGFAIGPIWHLNAMGGVTSQAVEMLLDPAVLCPAWLAGACGWGMCEVLPLVLRGAAERAAVARIAALKAEAKAIRDEWDLQERAV